MTLYRLTKVLTSIFYPFLLPAFLNIKLLITIQHSIINHPRYYHYQKPYKHQVPIEFFGIHETLKINRFNKKR